MKTENNEYMTIAIMNDVNIIILRHETNSLEIYSHDITEYNCIEKIIVQCRKYNVHNLWITPFTNLTMLFNPSFIKTTEGYKTYGVLTKDDDTNYIKFLRATKNDGISNIAITIPQFNYLWSFGNYDFISTNDLTIMLVLLRATLGIPIFNSPTYIGIKLLEHLTHNHNKQWLRSCDINWNDIPTANDLVWKCQEKIKSKKYLHAFDKNGSYLAVYESAMLGSGIPTKYENIVFEPKFIGVWNVTISGTSKYDDKLLPCPYDNTGTTMKLWTPQIKAVLKLGYSVEVHDALIWHETHYIFRRWAELIRDIRKELKIESQNNTELGYLMAYECIKNIYTKMGGRLGHRNENKFKDREGNNAKDVYQRIDWYSLVISEAFFRVLLTVDKFVNLNHLPIMIVNDCLYYLSNEKNYKLAVPNLTDNENELGGYKLKYSIEYNKVRKLFDSNSHPNDIAEHLNNLQRSGETF